MKKITTFILIGILMIPLVVAALTKIDDLLVRNNINVTSGNITLHGTGSCVIAPGGGRLCGNSSCAWIVSPDGGTVNGACD